MKFDILTLFPNMFEGAFSESIIKRAVEANKVEINIIDFRKYTKDIHNKVDDTPYGGGAGMVLAPQPIFDAVEDIRTEKSKVILLTPSGTPYKQKMAYDLSKEEHLIIICGHYEGFDERIRTLADMEISIGDYVLTGGEIPAMAIVDSITRLIPGVINERSHLDDSFNNDYLLDYPTYTKPQNYRGMEVPEVLISGNHQKIDEWRRQKSLELTLEKRPDLLNESQREELKRNKKID
jgi:tRNA (guanine37-N1)-methyltransferase